MSESDASTPLVPPPPDYAPNDPNPIHPTTSPFYVAPSPYQPPYAQNPQGQPYQQPFMPNQQPFNPNQQPYQQFQPQPTQPFQQPYQPYQQPYQPYPQGPYPGYTPYQPQEQQAMPNYQSYSETTAEPDSKTPTGSAEHHQHQPQSPTSPRNTSAAGETIVAFLIFVGGCIFPFVWCAGFALVRSRNPVPRMLGWMSVLCLLALIIIVIALSIYCADSDSC